ncbi:MAG: glycoside hydrolase family 3 protein [Spirochaetaceae bacterium]
MVKPLVKLLLVPLVTLFLFTLFAASAQPATPERGQFWGNEPPESLARALLEEMSDEEIVAQVFMVGWPGTAPSAELLRWIERRNIGGVKVFGWNTANLLELAETIGTLQRAATASSLGIPLFTATDQEGGWVRHVKGETSITPGNMAIGATGLPHDAFYTGFFIGREMRALGINMNFAPTVDVYVNPEAHVIGPRAFSNDPVESGILGTAYFKGLREAGVIATAKHYPGHGDAEGDSHGALPVIEDSFETIWNRDLVPYRFMIREGLPAVLSGHLSFPTITGDGRPASLSPYFKKGVLRERLNFEGIVITDDLYMGGAREYGAAHGMSFAEICLEALRAGSDMILLSRTPTVNDVIWQRVYREYRSDAEFRRQIRASVLRILRTKMEYLKGPNAVPLEPDPAQVRSLVPDSEGSGFFRDQASRSVTVVRDTALPLRLDGTERVLLVGKDIDFIRVGREEVPGAEVMAIEGGTFYRPVPEEVAEFRRRAGEYDHIIFCLSDPATREILAEAEDLAARVTVLSILTPVYLQELPWVQAAVAVYGWSADSYHAGFAAMRGEIRAEGRLPISIP